MLRTWAILAVLGICVTYADADEPPPRVPVHELPPFPTTASNEDKVVGVTVVGAQEAEKDVVVGASKREQSLGSVASAVTVISADQLRRFGFRTLAEALDTVAGLYMVDDRMIERVGIRGIQLLGDANTRILVLVDGSPLNEPWSQYVDTSHALPVHLDDVSRLEVIRGPVSSVYGTNAFFGIINIVTTGADKASRAYGRITVGSFREVSGNTGFAIGNVDRQLRGYASWLRRGGESPLEYDAFAGTVDDVDALSSLHAGLVAHYDRLFFQVRGSRRSRRLPGAPYDASIGSDANRNVDRHVFAELGYTREVSTGVTVAGRLYVDRYQFDGNLEYDAMPAFETAGNSLWYGGEVRSTVDVARYMPRKIKADITAGLAAEIIRTDSESIIEGASETLIKASFHTQGFYAELNVEPLPWLAATAGVRYDLNSKFESELSPRTALFFKRGERWGAKLLFAEGFRNPSVFEAFYQDGLRFQPNCVPSCELGAGLRSEEITSYEVVGWGQPFPGLKLRVSVWRWNARNLIEKRRVRVDDSGTERLQYQNLAQLRSQGIELETTYRDTRGWLAFANAALSHVRRNGEYAFNAPWIIAKAGVSSPLWLQLFHISTHLSVIGPRRTRDANTNANPYLGLNAAIYIPELRGLDISLVVRNIIGTRQQVPAQSDYDRQSPEIDVHLIPGAGREVYARIGYRY